MPKRRSPAGLVAAAAAVVLLAALVGPVAPAAAAPATATETGAAPIDAGCDATWRPAPVDDPRAPVGAGLTGPEAVGLGEPAIFLLRRGADDAAAPWTLFFPTTDSFGLPTTEGTVPAGPSLSRLCLRIDDPTAVGRELALAVGTFGPGTIVKVFRVTDPDPSAACVAPSEPVGPTVTAPLPFGPILEVPAELYPGRRNLGTIRVGGAERGTWTLEPPEGATGGPLGGALTLPAGITKGALCLDAVPAAWSGRAATLRVNVAMADGTAHEVARRLWVGDPAAPCDGRFRPIAAPTGPDGASPALHGPTEVARGAPATFVFVAGDPPPVGPHSFTVGSPEPRTYDGIPTRGALLPEAASAYALCLRPLDPAAVGQSFDLAVDDLHTRFVVTAPGA